MCIKLQLILTGKKPLFDVLEKQNFDAETKQYKKLEELANQFVLEHM